MQPKTMKSLSQKRGARVQVPSTPHNLSYGNQSAQGAAGGASGAPSGPVGTAEVPPGPWAGGTCTVVHAPWPKTNDLLALRRGEGFAAGAGVPRGRGRGMASASAYSRARAEWAILVRMATGGHFLAAARAGVEGVAARGGRVRLSVTAASPRGGEALAASLAAKIALDAIVGHHADDCVTEIAISHVSGPWFFRLEFEVLS